MFYDGRTSSPGRLESRSWNQEELDKPINENNYSLRPLAVIHYSIIASFQRNNPACGAEPGHYNNFEASPIGSMASNWVMKSTKLQKRILILTPYVLHVHRLRGLFRRNGMAYIPVHSLNASQGMESDIIILSIVRTHRNHSNPFLDDKKQINVGLSRARERLVIVSTTNSAAPVATLRAAIASDENAPGLLLRVYEDLRDRIAQNRQTTYSEVAATVTSDLSTNIDQFETRVNSLKSECRSLRIPLAAAEDRVRDLDSSPVSAAPLANIPTPTRPVASLPYSIPISPVNHAHTWQVRAASQTPTIPHISTLLSRLSPLRVRHSSVPRISSLPDHSEHPVIAPRHLRAVSPWRAANIHDATASAAHTLILSYAPTANSVIRYLPCSRTRAQTHLTTAFRHRRLVRDLPTSRQTNHTCPQPESRTPSYQAKTRGTHPDAQGVQRYEPD